MMKLKSDTKIYPDNYGAIKSKGKDKPYRKIF